MIPVIRRLQASVAAALIVAVTALSVAVPLLDRGRDPGALALTEPGAATGYVDHHHGVCVQYSAASWSIATGADIPSARLVREDDAPIPAVRRVARDVRSLPLSRAPPLV